MLDAIVVGAGAVGCAAAYHLTRLLEGRGTVLVLERRWPGHEGGSSHGPSRIIRLAYDHPAYVSLVREAFTAWEELERVTGETLLHRTGEVFFGPSDGAIRVYHQSLRDAGVPATLLDPKEVTRRYPAIRLPDDFVGMYQAAGGILAADRCLKAQLDRARSLGAALVTGEVVRAIESTASGISVTTDLATYRARCCVVAPGAWIGGLYPDLQLPLTVTRQQVIYLTPPRGKADAFRPGRFPVWVSLEDDIHYGIPIFGRFGVKVARHATGDPGVDPDSVDRTIDRSTREELRDLAARFFPGLAEAMPIDPHVCLYTNTPDEHFLLDRHPDDPRIAIASTCSGHGFKFSTLVGRLLAEMALGKPLSSPTYASNRELWKIGK